MVLDGIKWHSSVLNGIPEETWAMAYIGVEHEYKETNQTTGNLATKNVFKWNLRTGNVA